MIRVFLGLPSSRIISWIRRPSFEVVVSSNSLEMGATVGSGKYRKYQIAEIRAIPNTGYEFVRWSDGNTQAARNISVTENTTLVAYFQVKQTTHILTVSSNDPTLGSTHGSGVYNKGVSVVIRAIPTDIGLFVRWDDGNTSPTRQVVVSSDKTYVAIFEDKLGSIYYKPNY